MELGRLIESDLEDLAGLYRRFWNEDSDPERMIWLKRRKGFTST